jgi:hypothetical protein
MSRIPPKPETREGNVQRRVVGAAPDLGKIGKMATETRRRRRSKPGQTKGQSRRRSRTSKVLTNWLILILAVSGLAFASVLLWSFINQNDPNRIPTLVANTVPNLPADQGLAMVNKMLAAASPEDLKPLIRPGRLKSQQAFEYLQKLRSNYNNPPRPMWIGSLDSLSVPIEVISIYFSDTDNHVAMLTPDAHDQWKLDFDAFAQLCIPEFSTLLDEGDQEGLVRVHIMKDNYFNDWFGDDTEWDCYLLSRPFEETNLFGYCKLGSKAHAAMEALHQRGLNHTEDLLEESESNRLARKQMASRATLLIKRPPGSKIRQFEITNVVSDDWVISEKPFEERLAEKGAK